MVRWNFRKLLSNRGKTGVHLFFKPSTLQLIRRRTPIPRMPLFDSPETTEPVPQTIEVRVRGARVERTRDFGSVYLALTQSSRAARTCGTAAGSDDPEPAL